MSHGPALPCQGPEEEVEEVQREWCTDFSVTEWRVSQALCHPSSNVWPTGEDTGKGPAVPGT